LLLLHQDWKRDVVRVLAEDFPQPRSGEQIVFFRTEVQDDVRSSRVLPHGLDGVIPLAGALPADALVGRGASASGHERDAVRHDEGGVETDTELADKLGVPGHVGGQALEEFSRTGFGDGTYVIDDLLAGQANAIVRDRDCARRCVIAHPDTELRIAVDRYAVGHALEPQPVARVGRVRDELPQEDLLVAVQGVHHQVQQLLDLGLKTESFLRGCHGDVLESFSVSATSSEPYDRPDRGPGSNGRDSWWGGHAGWSRRSWMWPHAEQQRRPAGRASTLTSTAHGSGIGVSARRSTIRSAGRGLTDYSASHVL